MKPLTLIRIASMWAMPILWGSAADPARACIAVSTADSVLAEQAYFTALHAADDTTFQREFEREFLLLLAKPEAQMYTSLVTSAARKDFIAQYWKAANPNPLSRENDWLKDFLRRRAFARKNFPHPEPPFVDDRGKYYLKYGKPLRRYEDFGSLEVLANETWSYENVTRDFIVHFRREGKYFREVQNLIEILSGRRRFDPDTEAKVLIAMARQRASVSPVFGRVFAKWLDLNTAQRHEQSFPTSHLPLAIEWQQPHDILYAAAQLAKSEVAQAQRLAPPSAHDEIEALNRIALHEDYVQFRGPNGSTRVELAVLAPLKKNLTKKFSRESQEVLHLEYRALLNDASFKPLSEDSLHLELPLGVAAAHEFPNAVGKLVLRATPQPGDITVQIRNANGNGLGFTRKELALREFTSAGLMLSDLQLLFEVVDEEEKQFLPTETKQERVVAPYPFDAIRKAWPVLCYFEIYNLHMTNYELTYQITAAQGCAGWAEPGPEFKPDKNAAAISVTTVRPVTNKTQEELLALDLSQLKKGEYCLEITVADANDRTVAVRAQKHIMIAD
ncbi:GWxTD domain-containing protein [candidate division KSB1 bacterium]|nr:GWxTD domain-containing protein [candidate division KSB1 bacterium]